MIAVPRIWRAGLLAAACALFFATHVFVEYVGIRSRVVHASVEPAAGAVRTEVQPSIFRALRPPFAVILRIRNNAPAAQSFVVQIDGVTVCEPSVAGRSETRVDCVWTGGWTSSVPHETTVLGPESGWTLDYLELATHDGSSSGLLTMIILPRMSTQYRAPSLWWVGVFWIALTGILLLPAMALPPWLRWVHRIVVGLFALWCLVVLAAPWVSPYSVIVQEESFVMWLLLVLAPRLGPAVHRSVLALANLPTAWVSIGRVLLVAALVLACFGTVLARRLDESFHGNYSGFLRLSKARIEANPMLEARPDLTRSLSLEDSPGYDAQFMYAMAFDPFIRRYRDRLAEYQRFIDFPPYRYGRIGFSVLTRILSGGHASRYPATMILLILGSLAVCAAMIAASARGGGPSVLWGALIVLVPGFWTSLQSGLPEPVAAAALLAGYVAVSARRWAVAGLLFAVSVLVRETGVLFLACVAGSLAISGQRRVGLRLFGLSIAPLVFWRLYVGWVFRPEWGAVAFWNPPDDFGAPFAGLVGLWTAIARGQYWPDLWEMRRASLGYSAVILGGCALSWALAITRPKAVTIAAAGYGVMAVLFNLRSVWVQAGNAERLTSDLLMALALATAVGFAESARWIRIATIAFWTGAAAYVWFGMLDAQFLRGVLLAWW